MGIWFEILVLVGIFLNAILLMWLLGGVQDILVRMKSIIEEIDYKMGNVYQILDKTRDDINSNHRNR